MSERVESAASSGGSVRVEHYVGARIRMARERRAASPDDLARAVGTSTSSIANYEAGVEKISPMMLHKIAVTLDVTLGSLFGMDTA